MKKFSNLDVLALIPEIEDLSQLIEFFLFFVFLYSKTKYLFYRGTKSDIFACGPLCRSRARTTDGHTNQFTKQTEILYKYRSINGKVWARISSNRKLRCRFLSHSHVFTAHTMGLVLWLLLLICGLIAVLFINAIRYLC